jgi:hypothetical protein
MRDAATDEYQSPSDDVCADKPAQHTGQERAEEGVLKKGVF